MKTRSPGIAVVAIFVLAAVAVLAAFVARPDVARPPVILITIDTLRADRLGCYGWAAARTANLDRLAAEGALFEDACSSSPITLPSHTTILTGLHPPRHGLRDNDTPRPLDPPEAREFFTAPEVYREAGYATAAFVSGSPLSKRWGLDSGFQVYDAPPEGEPGDPALAERSGAETIDRALEWLGARDARRPFFLWVHLFDPHAPYRAPGGSGAPIDSPAAYDEEVAFADRQVGRLLESLRAGGLLDRCVVVATADHGEGLGDHGEQTHGFFLYRSTLRVPLIVRYPPRVAAGTRVADPVGLVDVLPTILDLSRRGPASRPLDGRPLFARQNPPGAGDLGTRQYAETLYGWRSFRWAQAVSLREGSLRVVDYGGGRREAYDVAADPGETTDFVKSQAPRPEPARAAETAWSLFASRQYRREGPPSGQDPGVGAMDPGVPYVSAYSPIRIQNSQDNGKLPMPSASFVARFETARRALERARGLESEEEAKAAYDNALALFRELEAEDPANPALPFWQGMTIRLKAKGSTQAVSKTPWFDAFKLFWEAGRRGYREPRTVSLMMEAAWHAEDFASMLNAAKLATGVGQGAEKFEGDAAFHCWVALAWLRGGDGSPEAKQAFRENIDKAKARARSEAESRKFREVESRWK